MPSLNLYSAGKVDDLLSVKLSVSSLSNAATSTLNATAPTAGQALTFDGTDLVWATVGGGGGGASWGSITGTLSSQTDLWTALSALAPTAGPSFTGTVSITGSWGSVTIGDSTTGSLALYNGSQTTTYAASGITFPDSTVQTTAATAGANLGDVVAISIVKDVTWTGSAWQLTFEPINQGLGNYASITVANSDSSVTEAASGSWSSSSTWTYTTSGFGSTDAIYIIAYGQKSVNIVNYP